jgi:hypothetical protein
VGKQAQQNVVVEDLVRENAWFCQQKCLTKQEAKKELVKGLISQFDPPATSLDISSTTICKKARSIIQFIATVLDERLWIN